jgi:hypothetical protein
MAHDELRKLSIENKKFYYDLHGKKLIKCFTLLVVTARADPESHHSIFFDAVGGLAASTSVHTDYEFNMKQFSALICFRKCIIIHNLAHLDCQCAIYTQLVCKTSQCDGLWSEKAAGPIWLNYSELSLNELLTKLEGTN